MQTNLTPVDASNLAASNKYPKQVWNACLRQPGALMRITERIKTMKTCLACIPDAVMDANVGDTLTIEVIATFHDQANGECFNHEND